ncbi:MAG: asparagine synthase C-terminal domain-containing protein [Nitrososphaeraceae archaeon]
MNLLPLLTLRYDPLDMYVPAFRLRDVSVTDLIKSKQNLVSVRILENKIRSAIRREVEKFNPNKLCVALSAGVDSNLVLCLLREEFPSLELECITVSFDEKNEALEAKRFAEKKDANFHQVYVENLLRDLPAMINIIREPRWNVYQYYFIKKAKSISNLLFTGDGGDEVFAGYTFRYKKFLQTCDNTNSLERAKLYLSCHERDWVPDQHEMFAEELKFDWSSIYSLITSYFNDNLKPLDQVMLADYNGKLMHDFVPTNDKYFRFFKLEGISPLLDNEVVELGFDLPPEMKFSINSNIGKLPLREILQNYSPDSDKKMNVKVGYGMDLVNLWKSSGRETVTMLLDKGRIFEANLINKNWYLRSLKRTDENADLRYISKLLQILSLEVWYRIFVTSEMNPSHHL